MKVKSQKSGDVILELGERDDQLLAAASAAPFRIKQILVPIDFSECSAKALSYAVALAQQHGATVSLLYVVHTFPVPSESGVVEYAAIQTQMREAGEDRLSRIIRELKGKVPTGTAIRVGAPAREIVQVALEIPADLIVISTHGHTGLKHVFLGSVAEQVVREAPCPVLVVREREREFITG